VLTLLLAPPTSGLLLFRRCSYLSLHRSLLTFCFQAVLISLPAPPSSGILFSGGAHFFSCTAHFRRSAFRRCSYLFLHRPLLTFCFQAVLTLLLAPLISDFLFSGGANISPCTALFSRSAFQAVRTLLLAPLTSDFLFSGGAHISSCTAHF